MSFAPAASEQREPRGTTSREFEVGDFEHTEQAKRRSTHYLYSIPAGAADLNPAVGQKLGPEAAVQPATINQVQLFF